MNHMMARVPRLARRGGTLLLHAGMTLLGVIWIYPFLWMVSASLKTQSEMYANALDLIPSSLLLDNYLRAWEKARFGTYFVNTVILAVSSTFIVVVICVLTGYVLGRYNFPGRHVIIAALVLPMFIPRGYTIVPVFDLINFLGLLDSRAGLILAESGWGYTLYMLLVAVAFRDIPQELEDAAVLDGCGFFRTFLKVMLPLTKPALATIVVLQFIASWNSYEIPLVLTLGRPELRTLGVGMFAFRGSHISDWTGLAAGATMAVVPIVGVFLAMQRYFLHGLAGAVKG